MWLGKVDDISEDLVDAQFRLQPGDLILLYTDGLTQTITGANRQRPGNSAVKRVFEELASKTESVEEILDGVMAQVEGYHAEADISVSVARSAPERTIS